VLAAEIATIDRGVVFANLVDFDQSFGHRNDPQGYAGALQEFDRGLPGIMDALGEHDVLLITADHGNDPSTSSTDHSRERTPLLAAGTRVRRGAELGQRKSFTDVAATVAELLGVPTTTPGTSFATALLG